MEVEAFTMKANFSPGSAREKCERGGGDDWRVGIGEVWVGKCECEREREGGKGGREGEKKDRWMGVISDPEVLMDGA